MIRVLLLGTVATVLALASAAAAPAGNNFFVGWTEDLPKEIGSQAVVPGAQLGGKAFRITLLWSPGQTTLAAADRTKLDRAFGAIGASRLRPVLSVYADAGSKAPQTATAREQYCAYVRSVIARYTTLRDVVIWNEPNLSFFWAPQFNADGSSAAPAAYHALAARCYDVLHAFRSSVNVIGPVLSSNGNDNPNAVSNVSHSPGNFIRRLGETYRASGRAKPLFDTIGHHAYGTDPWERPWRKHIGSKVIAEGDWNKLMSNLAESFKGTAQPIPGQMLGTRPVALWYLEAGHQTTVDAARTGAYHGAENETGLIPDYAGGEPESPAPAETSPAPDQHTQALDSIRLAYCQPYVEAYFNFLLYDEPRLEGWQSGPFWADRTRKDSYGAFQSAIAASNARTVGCAALKGGAPSADYTGPSAPAGLTAVPAGPQRVELAWGASGDTETGVAGYRVYRGGAFFSWSAGTAFADTTVKPSTTYAYTVYAQDGAGNLSAVSARVTATTPADTYPALVLSDGPLAYWRLGETAGGIAADERGAAPGIYGGGVALGVPGAINGDPNTGARFDGVDDLVRISGGAALTGAFTLEAWLNHSGIGPILEYGGASALGVHVWAYPSPHDLFLNLVDVTGGHHFLSAPGALVPGRWQHVAATYDGGTARLLVDGVEVRSATLGPITPRAGAGVDLHLGHRPYAGGPFTLAGALDEVAIYGHAVPVVRLRTHVDRARSAAAPAGQASR